MSVNNLIPTLDLGFDLVDYFLTKPDGPVTEDLLLSPSGLSTAFGLTLNAMDGLTWTQGRDAMRLPLEVDRVDLNRRYQRWLGALNSGDLGVNLSMAQMLLGRNDILWRESFLAANEEFFGALVRNVDFSNKSFVLDDPLTGINPWAFRKTGIEKAMTDLDANAIMLLNSAMAFKGGWTYQFPKEDTKEADFEAPGRTYKHPFMRRTGPMRYSYEGLFEFLALPYGPQQRVHYVVALPHGGVSFSDVLRALRPKFWELCGTPERIGRLALPRSSVKFGALLNEAIMHLGAQLPFGGGDFSRMVIQQMKIRITRVLQKNFFEIDEEGGTGGSITIVESGFESGGDGPKVEWRMFVNRPYLNFLVDTATQTVIFAGINFAPRDPKAKSGIVLP